MGNVLKGTVMNPEKVYGKSAYEVSVANGFDGTEEEWLYSLAEEANKLAKVYADLAGESAEEAVQANASAGEHEANAKTSEDNAKVSETNAKTSETNAKTSETRAKEYERLADSHRDSAYSSEVNAKASEVIAKDSETRAKNSETNALTSASNAAHYEAIAKVCEANAVKSANNAYASEVNAQESESNAQTYAERAEAAAESAEESARVAEEARDEARSISDGIGDELARIEGVVKVDSSDFVNGQFELGTGIASSEYLIITSEGVPVEKGDKIKIVPNGLVVNAMIESVSNLASVTVHLLNMGNIAEDTEIISDFDGFLFVQIRKSDGGKMTSADYVCDISIGTPYSEKNEAEINALEEKIDGAIDNFDKIVGKTTVLDSSCFVNGTFTAGTGITSAETWIITNQSIPVKVGDRISIKPNGFAVWWRIFNTDDLATATNLKNGGTATDEVEYVSEYDGYFNCQVRKTDNGNITPTDYVCDISVGTTRLDELEAEIDALEEKMVVSNDNFDKIVGKTTIFKPSDFVNGIFTLGTGIVSNEYSIITSEGVPIQEGDKIKIVPNGFVVNAMIESVSDLASVTVHLLNKANITEDTEIISDFDGFLFIRVANNGLKITPTDYVCDISVGTTRLDELEVKDKELEGRIEAVESKCISLSPKHKPFTKIINDCQTIGDWRDSVTADTTDFIIGTQSLNSNGLMRCIKHAYNMVENDLVVKFKINAIGSGATLQLSIGHVSGGGRVVYRLAVGSSWTMPSGWQEIAIPYTGYAYGSVDGFDFSNVDDLIFTNSEGDVDYNIQYIGLRPKALKKGIVTFTFDDGYKSQATGIKLLAEKGITGTIFHIKEATDNGSEQVLTIAELQELVNHYGADIEVHGDPSYDQWEETDLAEHWANSQKWLKENGLGDGKHMAYPNGMFPENVVQLAKGYFDSCRTITPFIPFETYPTADRYRIRAVSGVSAYNVTATKVKEYIDRVATSGGWLILVFHKIGDGTDSMWCSETDLKDIADHAINSGAYIMNYAEVFDSVVIS